MYTAGREAFQVYVDCPARPAPALHFVVMAILIAILGGTAIVTMPVDIFPYIDIPIVTGLFSYNGLVPDEMEKRVVTNFERSSASM